MASRCINNLDEFSIAVTDLNGDQRADRVLRTGSAISVMFQNTLSPVFTQQPMTVTAVPAGESVTYSIDTDPAIQSGNVQWQSASAGAEDWTDIPGAVDPAYTFTAAAGDAGKRFRALVTTSDGLLGAQLSRRASTGSTRRSGDSWGEDGHRR